MKSTIESISITDKELYFLACLTGADQVLGIAEPYSGYLTEDIQEEWDQIKVKLLGKGYLYEDETGIYIDSIVDALVSPCGFATTCCYFRYANENEKAYEGYFHFDKESVVEKRAAKGEGDSYELIALGTPQFSSQDMCNRLRLYDGKKLESKAILLPNVYFQELREMAEEKESNELENSLLAHGCPRVEAAVFAESLNKIWCQGQLIVMSWYQNDWSLNGATFITSANGNWLIRLFVQDREDWVSISSVTDMEMNEVLQGMIMEKLLPRAM
ncbi:hypothetical protein [Brevibacillus daliensis]|uniref:hypothetical protein n=1 Tax=Brevibacillus daliensis TaxID=2892995 RepID=UPI001E60CC67|nr:hypothetical protein [Brevibacillus daliensis]